MTAPAPIENTVWMTSRHQHWESVYRENDHEMVGWYQSHPSLSLDSIESCAIDPDAAIVNIGGGSSVLVDHLLDAGYSDVTVLDLSATALAVAQMRLGGRASDVTWAQGDVTEHDFDRVYRVWHDRAAFHFLTNEDSQLRYVEQLRCALAPGGNAILATFALDGPERCSGLPVVRYGEESLADRLGNDFEPMRFEYETHKTPGGVTQEYLYGHFRRRTA